VSNDSDAAPGDSRPGGSGPVRFVAWAVLALLIHLLGLVAKVLTGALMTGVVFLGILLC